ncbi:hypothetical protein Bca52824_027411 [Brassica carinata]|uniref:Uncharacterized protein n=1 Tax=Brassica carinata TaxID=52824 RepID=A0A8X7SJS1_BRACI|nr:hypothetical protein Bca52824_027411 [Brassica carinata]
MKELLVGDKLFGGVDDNSQNYINCYELTNSTCKVKSLTPASSNKRETCNLVSVLSESADTKRCRVATTSELVKLHTWTLCSRFPAEFLSNGMTQAMMRMEMKIELAGSATNHPLYLIKSVDTTTPTLPMVSAKT